MYHYKKLHINNATLLAKNNARTKFLQICPTEVTKQRIAKNLVPISKSAQTNIVIIYIQAEVINFISSWHLPPTYSITKKRS